MKLSVTTILIALLMSLSLGADVLMGKVVSVSDGGTITVLDSSNGQHKIRLAGIDAPEKKQAYGEKAKQHLSEMIFGREVKVEWQIRLNRISSEKRNEEV